MEGAISPESRAVSIAKEMEGSGCEITHDRTDGNWYGFSFTGGCVQAHRIPDGWAFSGIGTGWFSIKQE